MNTKTKKIVNTVINVIVFIIIMLIFAVTIGSINSKEKGYNNFFGISYYAVKTDSMEGDKKDSFNKGDLIIVKPLKTEVQQMSLKKGQVITFFDMIDGNRQLNSHRIVNVLSDGVNISYVTKGDNSDKIDNVHVTSGEVVGQYKSKVKGLGHFILFMQSSTGFLIMVVIPSVLIFAYCMFLFFKNYKVFLKEKASVAGDKQASDDELKEKLRQEILNEMKTPEEKQADVADTDEEKQISLSSNDKIVVDEDIVDTDKN